MSYTNVHITPEKYKGRHTDQSQEPFTAAQPSRAPQLKVSPAERRHEQDFSFTDVERQRLWDEKSNFPKTLTQYELWPVSDPLHQWVSDDKRERRGTKSYAAKRKQTHNHKPLKRNDFLTTWNISLYCNLQKIPLEEKTRINLLWVSEAFSNLERYKVWVSKAVFSSFALILSWIVNLLTPRFPHLVWSGTLNALFLSLFLDKWNISYQNLLSVAFQAANQLSQFLNKWIQHQLRLKPKKEALPARSY